MRHCGLLWGFGGLLWAIGAFYGAFYGALGPSIGFGGLLWGLGGFLWGIGAFYGALACLCGVWGSPNGILAYLWGLRSLCRTLGCPYRVQGCPCGISGPPWGPGISLGVFGTPHRLWGPAGVPLCHLPDPKHRQPQPRHGVPFDGQNLKLGKKLGFPHFWQLTPEVNGIPWGDGTLLGLMGSSGVNGIHWG